MNSEKAVRPGSLLLTSVKARCREVRTASRACVLGPEGGLTHC